MPHNLTTLPKAHLHLHLTGAMRHSTMVELARTHGVSLPPALTEEWPPRLSTADERGWFRFQRLYDTARSVLRTPDDVYRLLRETAEDERAEGSGWLELQADPSGYAARFGGVTAFTELLLDAVATAAQAAGVGIGIIIAANRTRHPMDARTLARLAVQFAGRGVVGFGLSNDQRSGPACCWPRTPASCSARRASARRWTGCTRTGSGTASGPSRTRRSSKGSPPRGSRSRSARPRMCRSASRPTPPRCRCAPCSRPECRSRWGRTTRCSSAGGW